MIVLGSTSKYRAELLCRLGQPFTTAKPQCDETPQANELPDKLAARLAHTKASSLVSEHPLSIIIGSDQVASTGTGILGKPGSVENAKAQLQQMRGQPVQFYTALCLIDAGSGKMLQAMDTTTATLRQLSDAEISRYVDADNPLDCAGSFKVESLGISLFERIETSDPTALIGLPLIQLCRCLRDLGLDVP